MGRESYFSLIDKGRNSGTLGEVWQRIRHSDQYGFTGRENDAGDQSIGGSCNKSSRGRARPSA